MAKRDYFPIRRPGRSSGSRLNAFHLALFVMAAASIALGVFCLWGQTRAIQPGPVLAPAGLVLLVSGLIQLRIARTLSRGSSAAWPATPRNHLSFCRRLVSGSFIAYLVALMIGPIDGIVYLWVALVAVWHTVMAASLTASPLVIKHWQEWTRGRGVRQGFRLVHISLLLLIATELALDVHALCRQMDWQWGARPAMPVISDLDHFDVADEDNLSADSGALKSTAVRVAVLSGNGDRPHSSGDAFLSRVKVAMPGIEFVTVGTSKERMPAELATRLTAIRPDLVLVVASACEDLAKAPRTKSWFDCQRFLVAQCVLGDRSTAAEVEATESQPTFDLECFLRNQASRLAACRTPIDATMQAHWQQTFESLEAVRAECNRQSVPMALVLLPGEFQVNRTHCAMLARRSGMRLEQIDLDLPQRKVAGFAESHDVPLIDLLPSLRLCRESPYERNATRLNEQGNTLAAKAIGGWLESRFEQQLVASGQSRSSHYSVAAMFEPSPRTTKKIGPPASGGR